MLKVFAVSADKDNMKSLIFNQNRKSQGALPAVGDLPTVVEAEKAYWRYVFKVIDDYGDVVHEGEVDCDIAEAYDVEKIAREDYARHIRHGYAPGYYKAEMILSVPITVKFERKQIQ